MASKFLPPLNIIIVYSDGAYAYAETPDVPCSVNTFFGGILLSWLSSGRLIFPPPESWQCIANVVVDTCYPSSKYLFLSSQSCHTEW